MVCSSTLRAMAVIHSAKRRKPGRVKAQAKALSRACQVDQVSVASVMMRLLCRGRWGSEPPGRFRSGDAAFNTVRPLSRCEFFRETSVYMECLPLRELPGGETEILG